MPYKSQAPWVPLHISVPSFLFDSPSAILDSTKPLLINAKNPDVYFTLHTYREWSRRFAAGLVAAGLKSGDRLTLFSGNTLFTPVVILGTLMAGGIYNSANPAYTPRELAHQLKDAKPKFVLAADNCVSRALESADLSGLARDCVYLFESMPMQENGTSSPASGSGKHWSSLIATPSNGKAFTWEDLNTPELSNHTAVLVYSSGTTGLPKGVEVSHFNLVSNARQVQQAHFAPDVASRQTICCLPMYHGLGLAYYTITVPKSGMQTYMMERYRLEDMLDHIQKYKISELLLVPPILVAISKHSDVQQGKYNLDSVKKVVAGAAPIGMEISQEFEKIFSGRLKVRQGWGMSE